MTLLLVMSLAIFALSGVVYVLNEQSVAQHNIAVEKITALSEFIKGVEHDRHLDDVLNDLELPANTGVFVVNNAMDKIIGKKTNDIGFSPDLITPETKQTFLVRAKTGGGIVVFPWKERCKENGVLMPILASVFSSKRSTNIFIVASVNEYKTIF